MRQKVFAVPGVAGGAGVPRAASRIVAASNVIRGRAIQNGNGVAPAPRKKNKSSGAKAGPPYRAKTLSDKGPFGENRV